MEADKNYKKGDIVYLCWKDKRLCCPAEYIGRFKDRFDVPGWIYCLKPLDNPEPYGVIQINANELDGKTVELIPFGCKPACYGKVKR